MEKKIFPPFLPRLKPVTFWSRVRLYPSIALSLSRLPYSTNVYVTELLWGFLNKYRDCENCAISKVVYYVPMI